MTPVETNCGDTYDVVVIGGAFCGATFALLLRRWLPSSRVLIVEREERFERKVGESTVEVAAGFLGEVLGLHEGLCAEQLVKQGLRYWFTDDPARNLWEMSELGLRAAPPVPGFQLDRSKLDEGLLELAIAEGSEALRPGRVVSVDQGWPESRVEIEVEGRRRQVVARWVIDASGRHAFLARRKRLLHRIERHPTAASWARWRGMADLDGAAVLGPDPQRPRLPKLEAERGFATNHFCGYGWWCWVIPLVGGEISIGVVWNKDLATLGTAGSPAERYMSFVTHQSGLRELLTSAEMDRDDFHTYQHLPYKTSRYMGRGWALLGDAAAFLDPYLSSGLDHGVISVYATARLLWQDLLGHLHESVLDERVATHNQRFGRSYDRWLDALFVGKYELMGDADLLRSSFLLDSAFYYLGIVTPFYKRNEALEIPYFGLDNPLARLSYHVVRGLKGRLIALARFRRRMGTYGKRNLGLRIYPRPFGLGWQALVPLARGLGIWLWLELDRAWTAIVQRVPATEPYLGWRRKE